MGKDLVDAYPACADLYRKAGEVLGYDLAQLCAEGPEETLKQSDHAQPAIFVHSMACLTVLKEKYPDVEFAMTAGLSSGEWAALYAAGVLGFEDALKILAARGRFMQEACEQQQGGMLSVIGLAPEALEGVAREAGVQMANYNSPQQTVLSGPVEGIQQAEKLAKEAGAKRAIPLQVAGAFHSSLMDLAARQLNEFIREIPFSEPSVPVVSNITAQPHGSADDTRRRMTEQVNSSVRWVECVQWMRAQGVDTFVECGPGKVLSGLVKRIDKQAAVHNIQGVQDLETFKEQ
jgi:[acyl-carrier-protein] S-malonyltransferase